MKLWVVEVRRWGVEKGRVSWGPWEPSRGMGHEFVHCWRDSAWAMVRYLRKRDYGLNPLQYRTKPWVRER